MTVVAFVAMAVRMHLPIALVVDFSHLALPAGGPSFNALRVPPPQEFDHPYLTSNLAAVPRGANFCVIGGAARHPNSIERDQERRRVELFITRL
jgi:hypothetical protein